MSAREELDRLMAKVEDVKQCVRAVPRNGLKLKRVHQIRREAGRVNRGKCSEMAARFDELGDDDEVFIATVVKVVGKSEPSISRYIKNGSFPSPARKVHAPGMPSLSNVWRVGDVRAWLARRVEP